MRRTTIEFDAIGGSDEEQEVWLRRGPALRRMFGELPVEVCQCLSVLRHDHDARGEAVEPVNDSCTTERWTRRMEGRFRQNAPKNPNVVGSSPGR